MIRDKRKFTISLISLIIVIALVASFVSAAVISAFAAEGTSASALRSKISDIAGEKEQLQKELDQISSEKKSVLQKKSELERKANLNLKEIEASEQLMDELSSMIKVKNEELEQAEQRQNEQYQLFLSRMRAMYEMGEISYLEVLLDSSSFYEMQSRVEIINKIISYDKNLVEQLKQAKQQVLEAKQQLEQDKAEQSQLMDKLEKTKKSLDGQISESEKISSELEKDEESTKAAYEEMEKEEAKLQAELKKLVAASASKSSYVGGSMTWPLPGHTYISSPFGYRIHPTLKVKKLHTGVDIPAPKGTKILAANSGEVIISAYSKAWGNYVVVNHGGGTATLYAHMSKRLVAKGDSVSKGQNIGLVGTTGYSTGNHLHFEIQKNGVSVDPFASEFKK